MRRRILLSGSSSMNRSSQMNVPLTVACTITLPSCMGSVCV